jgi:hypothetical protein
MKRATVKYLLLNKEVEGRLIEDSEDIKEYCKVIESLCDEILTDVMSSKASMDYKKTFDHMIGLSDSLKTGLMTVARTMFLSGGDFAIYNLGAARNIMLTGLIKGIKNGDKIFVNDNGGFCPITPGVVELVSVKQDGEAR